MSDELLSGADDGVVTYATDGGITFVLHKPRVKQVLHREVVDCHHRHCRVVAQCPAFST